MSQALLTPALYVHVYTGVTSQRYIPVMRNSLMKVHKVKMYR